MRGLEQGLKFRMLESSESLISKSESSKTALKFELENYKSAYSYV